MDNNNTKILTFLALLIFTGFMFVFFTNTDLQKNDKFQTAKAAKQETKIKDGMFSEDLEKFKDTITSITKGDLKTFKSQTSKAFKELAELIEEVAMKSFAKPSDKKNKEKSEEANLFAERQNRLKREVQENLKNVEKSAQKILKTEDKEEIVREIKEGFRSSKKALNKAADSYFQKYRQEMINNRSMSNKEKGEKSFGMGSCKCVRENMDKIEKEIDKISTNNYKNMTKKVFMRFHSTLKCLSQHTCKMSK